MQPVGMLGLDVGFEDVGLVDGNAVVGTAVGRLDGCIEGAILDDGLVEGGALPVGGGVNVGVNEGVAVGATDGVAEGASDGAAEGAADGDLEGIAEGGAEGSDEGVEVGDTDGVLEGDRLTVGRLLIVGSCEGAKLIEGALEMVGKTVGDLDGETDGARDEAIVGN
jgi:hypothetical protein